jgi:hypothetical protein
MIHILLDFLFRSRRSRAMMTVQCGNETYPTDYERGITETGRRRTLGFFIERIGTVETIVNDGGTVGEEFECGLLVVRGGD